MPEMSLLRPPYPPKGGGDADLKLHSAFSPAGAGSNFQIFKFR